VLPLAGESLSLPVFVAAAAVAVLWWLVAAILFVLRRPPRLHATGAGGLDLPDEPPAVAGLLANDFVVPGEVAPAIVLDLAAQGALTLDEVQPGRTTCTVKERGELELSSYELRILAELGAKAIDGIVPTDALTTGPEDQSERWHRVLAQEVVDDAQARGLTVDRWPKRIVAPFGVTLVVIIGLAFAGLKLEDDVPTDRPVLVGVVATLALLSVFAGFVLTARLGRSLAQLPTASGRDAATRAVSLAAQLRSNPTIAELPPAGVKLWDRVFAYAAAFGAAPRAVALLPMGAEDDHRAWSRSGGVWRRVRVRYPRGLPPAWGKHPLIALALALFWGAVAAVVLFGLRGLVVSDRPTAISRSAWDWVERGGLLAMIPCVIVVGWALWVLVRAVPDLWQTRTVTGEIVRGRRFRQWFSSGDEPKYWYYAAIDDGTTDHLDAWRLSEVLYRDHAQGEQVTAEVTPRLGYVRTLRRS
jgi:Predicted membrane protein (DUF2207) C-terminal domain